MAPRRAFASRATVRAGGESMAIRKRYLFRPPEPPPAEELCEEWAAGPAARVERIFSTGQASPPGFWYDQERDEWVALLSGAATLLFADGERVELAAGDALLIPARTRHRVERTSADPPCVWVAVHADLR